ncbi:MAG: DUF4956 domain-containing protein [Gemmatimonadaceae bacterium]
MSPDDVRGSGGVSVAGRRLLAIVAYYLLVGLAIALLWEPLPDLRQLLAGTSLPDLASGAFDTFARKSAVSGAGEPDARSALAQGQATLLALAGALLTAIPVAWVYSLTRRRKGYEQSMVHIIILLPIAVAGMVVLIQNSLALAFSLAGIVAVLRFRNSLEDVKDGVYVFIGVSIGMSAAIGALGIGLVTSTVFNVSVLMLWWLDFARRPTPGIRGGWRRLMRLPKVVPPKPVPVERKAVDGRDGEEVFASAARAWRRQLQLTSEHRITAREDGFNASLRVHTSAPDVSRPALEQLLQERTRKWELKGIVPGEQGTFTLKYQIRVRRAERGELLDAVRSAPQTVGVELR